MSPLQHYSNIYSVPPNIIEINIEMMFAHKENLVVVRPHDLHAQEVKDAATCNTEKPWLNI